jgi:curved DNA-binding protein CbpA
MLPADDLYARLEVPVDASFETIEVAWRALLKRHHPDVAGGAPDADERAKRINVAHDWLSDPDLRSRYDRERRTEGLLAGTNPRRGPRPDGTGIRPVRPASPTARRRAVDPEELLLRHLDRIGRLTQDEIDRMSLADAPPIAFVASISRFLPPDLLASLESVERRVSDRLPRSVRWNAGVRDAAVGFAQEIVLAAFLDEHLSPTFRERVNERLTRGWSAAVDQPRYGPNGRAVTAAVERLRRLSEEDLQSITAAAARSARSPGASASTARGAPPWPPGLRPDEDDALRVSSELARRDAVTALPSPVAPATRRSLERAIHALVLRHAFATPAFDALLGPWRGPLGVDVKRPSVRQGDRPRG